MSAPIYSRQAADYMATCWQKKDRLISAAPALLHAARVALGNLLRNLDSEEVCGQPFMGDDEHEAIRVLKDAISQATGELP